MGLFRRRARSITESPEVAAPTTLEIRLEVDTYDFPGDSGEQVHGQGVVFRETAFGTIVRNDDPRLADAGIYVTKVAGVSHRLTALQAGAFAPMEVLTLRRDPDHDDDPNAIEVRDRKGRMMIGYVPAELAVDLAPILDRGDPMTCRCMWEWRGEDGTRSGVRILIAPDGILDIQ